MRRMVQRFLLFAVLAFCFACQKVDKDKAASGSGSAKPTPGSGGSGAAPAAAGDALDSKDILARTKTADEVMVKHVLISWKEMAAAFRGQQDPRGAARSKADAEKVAKETLAKIKAKPADIDAIVKELSEDPGSAQSGEPYTVKADTPFVPEFKNLALRLELNEAGIVKTSFGYHVMLRIPPPPPPPPDPLDSADILARPAPAATETVQVQHIMVTFKGATRAKPDARSKEDADKLVKEILEKVKAGGDMAKLMKEHSEDPGSKDTGRAYPIKKGSGMPEPLENLALRLKEGEAGLVKSPFGWHLLKRVPPPPPDALDSADILKRPIKTEKAQVKHILLGWTEFHADDERGKKRSRKDLEKLVKETVAKLKKGDKIETLMTELSEDQGSAKTGMAYPVTPDAGLVEPFKNLSLRLDVNEVGVVKTDFGIHIIKRIE
jgi:parvulin-like peptidyl-prolyl isomerase